MHRVVSRVGVPVVGVFSAASGLLATGYLARTPALHSLPSMPLLGTLALVMLPIAAVSACAVRRRGAAGWGPACEPLVNGRGAAEPEAGAVDVRAAALTAGAPAPVHVVAAPGPCVQRHTEPGTPGGARDRPHRRRVRHAGR
jgi:hypothetical protein